MTNLAPALPRGRVGLALAFGVVSALSSGAWAQPRPNEAKPVVIVKVSYSGELSDGDRTDRKEAGLSYSFVSSTSEALLKIALRNHGFSEVYTEDEFNSVCSAGPQATRACRPSPRTMIELSGTERRGRVRWTVAIGDDSSVDGATKSAPSPSLVPIDSFGLGLGAMVDQVAQAVARNGAGPTALWLVCKAGDGLQAKVNGLARALQSVLRISSELNVQIARGDKGELDCRLPLGGKELVPSANHSELELSLSQRQDGAVGIDAVIRKAPAGEGIKLPSITLADGASSAQTGRAVGTLEALTRGLLGRNSDRLTSPLYRGVEDRLLMASEAMAQAPPDYDTADAEFEFVLSGDEYPDSAAIEYADSLSGRARSATAMAVLDRARARRDTAELALAHAEVLSQGRTPEAALPEYDAILKRDDITPPVELAVQLGRIRLAWNENAGRAFEDAEGLIHRFPQSGQAVLLAGGIAEDMLRVSEAKRIYRDALGSNPGNAANPRLDDGDADRGLVASRLANLLLSEASSSRVPTEVLKLVDEAIQVEPSLRAHEKRGEILVDLAPTETDRKARFERFRGAASEFRIARGLMPKDDPIGEHPWLIPNMIEADILSGQFAEAQGECDQFFNLLGKARDLSLKNRFASIRAITAFLNYAAALLNGDSVDRSEYLFRILARGVPFRGIGWSFDDMKAFLDRDYRSLRGDLTDVQFEKAISTLKGVIAEMEAGDVRLN